MATHDYPATSSSGPDISGAPNAGEYARFADADTLEARTTAQVLSDIGAQAKYMVTGTLVGSATGVKITTTVPPTDGQYIFEIIINRGAGYSYVRKTAQFLIAGGVISGAIYGDSFGTSHPDCQLWMEIAGGFLVVYVNASVAVATTATITTSIYTAVSLAASALTGWAYADGTGAWPALLSGESHTLLFSLIQAGVKLDDLATPDDNTDLNASSTRHGLLPKLSNVVTEFLTGTGAWATPSTGNFFACNVHKNATQSVAASTEAAITWQVDEYDPDAIHDTGANTGRFTIPTGGTGIWLFGMICMCNYSTTRPTVRLAVNGTGVTAYRKMQAPPANQSGPQPYITLVNVTQGDYVEFWWDTNDAGAANSIYGGNNGDANEGYNSIAFCIGPFGGA